jgi:hypothetical protein
MGRGRKRRKSKSGAEPLLSPVPANKLQGAVVSACRLVFRLRFHDDDCDREARNMGVQSQRTLRLSDSPSADDGRRICAFLAEARIVTTEDIHTLGRD